MNDYEGKKSRGRSSYRDQAQGKNYESCNNDVVIFFRLISGVQQTQNSMIFFKFDLLCLFFMCIKRRKWNNLKSNDIVKYKRKDEILVKNIDRAFIFLTVTFYRKSREERGTTTKYYNFEIIRSQIVREPNLRISFASIQVIVILIISYKK
jgi:hypothetical protein